MLIYLCSPTLSQISLKNSFGKILVKIEMMRNKNRLFDRHLERYNIKKSKKEKKKKKNPEL